MLKLINIKKNYIVENNVTKALKDVNLEFRKNEFVSILGPSGCGKTTLLNIIGGLDKATSGDLVINNVSTKKYKSYDWDAYRNNKIGFVFQSYNLIPHQNILRNVELSLTLSGVNKDERRKRVIKALFEVGLGDQIHKKPNQLSGGQMQRVAIARALVNNPEIILADEPTGALDTESGQQVIDLLKEVAKDRLVIMVTHNKELAQEYSTRIINLKDGEIASDSNPYFTKNDNNKAPQKEKRKMWLSRLFKRKKKKTSMSLTTAISLSSHNLISKKGRSFLTSFAGSIGIIGISLVLALSAGVSNYVDTIEKDALSLYPLDIKETNISLPSMLTLLGEDSNNRTNYPNEETVYIKKVLGNLSRNINDIISTNDLKKFKVYLDENFDENLGYIRYDYGVDFNAYCNYLGNEDSYIKVNPFIDSMNELLPEGLLSTVESFASMMSMWDEMIDNKDLLKQQYELVGTNSKWPEKMDELVLVLDEKNQLDDYALLALGLKATSTRDILQALTSESPLLSQTYNIDELLTLEYKLMSNADYYYQDESSKWKKHNLTKDDIEFVDTNSAVTAKVVGILRPKRGAISTSINGIIGYSSELKEHMISVANNHPATQAQRLSVNKDIVSDAPLKAEEYKKLLLAMGDANTDIPKAIKIYSYTFEDKEQIKLFIEDYNKQGRQGEVIKYTDTLATLMGYVDTFTKTVTGVLIGFSSISLIVSSIMIAIIIYTSILERRKEIGVLRSLGASKKDVSHVFIAESAILGVAAGLIGIIITFILTFPVNIILFSMFSVSGLAVVTWWHVVLMVGVSLLLSILAGFIPSRIAAQQDPVEALRAG